MKFIAVLLCCFAHTAHAIPCPDNGLTDAALCSSATPQGQEACKSSYAKIQDDHVMCGWIANQCVSTGPKCEAESGPSGPSRDPVCSKEAFHSDNDKDALSYKDGTEEALPESLDAFTIAGWFRFDDSHNAQCWGAPECLLISSGASGGFYAVVNRQNSFHIHMPGGMGDISLSKQVSNGHWYFLAFTYASSGSKTWQGYVRKWDDSSSTYKQGNAGNKNMAKMAKLGFGKNFGAVFPGQLLHWTTWSRALSKGEMDTIFNKGRPYNYAQVEGLTHWWRMDYLVNNEIPDEIGSLNWVLSDSGDTMQPTEMEVCSNS